ncbi:MAG: hypothetical protein U1E83_05980 [Methylotetracoccus sp.]
MTDSTYISSAPPTRTSTDYAALRERGMDWIRLWATESWTDHNVHDPGITLLEAFCYSMTELGLRFELDVADLLRSGAGHAAPDIEPAHRVLPVGPVNAKDLRRVLLDHPIVSDAHIFAPADSEVPVYLDASVVPPLTYTANDQRMRPAGLYEVLIELSERSLNINTYDAQVTVDTSYDLELALPFWDDPEAAPFRQPVTVTAVAMIETSGAWRALPESQSYFGRATVSYTDTDGTPGSIEVWVLMRITTPVAPLAPLPTILDRARDAVNSIAVTAPVPTFAARVRAAADTVDTLRTYIANWRNLGEQAVRIGLARVQEIAVTANLEVTGGLDLEMLAARIFLDIDAELSPRVRFLSLEQRRAEAGSAEAVYDGPLLRRGFPSRTSLDARPPNTIYTSDILRIIMRRRDATGSDLVTQENPSGRAIVAVTSLSLANYINNRIITSRAEDCLHLVEIERYRPRLSIAKSHLVAVRNDAEVPYDFARVQTLFHAMQAEVAKGNQTDDPSPAWPVVAGAELPVEDYTPLQQELPTLYGMGDAVLPDSVGPERRAAAKQLEGYLLPVEQLLGDVTTQLANINRFFSGAADEDESYYLRAPFDLPDARKLLKQFPPGSDWQAFISNPDNPVMRALRNAAEDREQFLDRRNRMLDHLLARHGEDAVALAQEVHRWARAELLAAALPSAIQEAAIAARRLAANARLLVLKSALLRDLPELNGFRLLANGSAFLGDDPVLRIERADPVPLTGEEFRWYLSPAGAELLRAVDPLDTAIKAGIAAERAFMLAGRPSSYIVVDVGGGQQRLRLFDGGGGAPQVLAESTQSFTGVAAANAALPALAATFASRRMESSLSPMERRVAHYTGIRGAARRRSLTAVDMFFDTVNEPAPPGMVGRRWRLRGLPAGTGPMLLMGAARFDAPTAPQADALALAEIPLALRYGVDEWNYRIVPPAGPGPFIVELRDPAEALIATAGATFATMAEAQAALRTAVEHLYRSYGTETFYLIEHLLLRPRSILDPFLSLPIDAGIAESDPYSQRISLVFPSGRARDFALPHETAPTSVAAPARFRDPEFRRHVELMVQRACPAHLLPTIYWVDRQAPGTGSSPASFDSLEERYFTWLDTVLIPGAPAVAIDNARNALVGSLNAIANDVLP